MEWRGHFNKTTPSEPVWPDDKRVNHKNSPSKCEKWSYKSGGFLKESVSQCPAEDK